MCSRRANLLVPRRDSGSLCLKDDRLEGTNFNGDVPHSLVPLPTSRQDNLPLQAGRGQTAFRSPAPGARNRGSRPIAAASFRGGRLGSTTSRSKPPHDRSAVRPEADTLNRTVRSRFTPPEREFFKPARLRASSNSLNYRASNIRTKMAVVRLLRRKWAERDEKRPEVGPQPGPHGSDKWPGMAAFCGIPTADQERKKNVPTGVLAEGSSLATNTLFNRALSDA